MELLWEFLCSSYRSLKGASTSS